MAALRVTEQAARCCKWLQQIDCNGGVTVFCLSVEESAASPQQHPCPIIQLPGGSDNVPIIS